MDGGTVAGFRGLADEVRAFPLGEVAPLLGYCRDASDRARWRREGSVISVTGMKFYDHLQGRGGGGAIDLVIHARGCGAVEAIRWLAATFGASAVGVPAAAGFFAPSVCDPCWPRVRAWLTDARGLEGRRVDALRSGGLIYADARCNAVFLCRDSGGASTGAELVGTRRTGNGSRFRGMAPGSRKAAGGFWFAGSGSGAPSSVFIAESAIDALSAAALGVGASIHASVAGVCRRLPNWLEGFAPASLACGFDADGSGDGAAAALIAADGRLARIRPSGAKDWNEMLTGAGSASVAQSPAVVSRLQDGAVVSQAVEQRRGHPGVAEDAGPFAELQVDGDDRRRPFVQA